MEIKTKEIFEKANIRHFREFLFGGPTVANDYCGTYEERLCRDREDIINSLKRYLKDENQFNETANDLTLVLMTYRDVYTEIGMKIGAKIMFEFLSEAADE